MEDDVVPTPPIDWTALAEEAKATLLDQAPLADRMRAMCAVLSNRVPHYDWVGFYFPKWDEENVLALGPYHGAHTDHARIPYGIGICGQVAASRTPMVVPDITLAKNYLSCSVRVRAEIVVPIVLMNRFFGVLDIDAHTKDPFTQADLDLLTDLANAVAPYLMAQAGDLPYDNRPAASV